jgi:molybdopterin/thiamine biosynthesis adenylyltransferase
MFSVRSFGTAAIALVHEAGDLNGRTWVDAAIPAKLPETRGASLHKGIWVRTPLAASAFPGARSLSDLQALLSDVTPPNLLAVDGSSPVDGFPESIAAVIAFDGESSAHFFLILSCDKATHFTAFQSVEPHDAARVLRGEALPSKSIGIVGAGSAGSKIAVSLARMGASRFYLVDDDILLPENLKRHALDWQGVGQHKVHAVAEALQNIDGGIVADVAIARLTGQESSAWIAGVLERLADCDLVVDASANTDVFNLLVAVLQPNPKALVWLEIFGGGIGGLVARCRPESDPDPQQMRASYLQFCEKHPAPPSMREKRGRYESTASGDDVLSASDADVGIIAGHAARFVADSLLSPEASIFPHSMYLVGLAREWVFTAPFSTIPISITSSEPWRGKEVDASLEPEMIEFLTDLIEKSES